MAKTLIFIGIMVAPYFYLKRRFSDVCDKRALMGKENVGSKLNKLPRADIDVKKMAECADAMMNTEDDEAFVMLEEVRDVATQSQVTYGRELLQLRFQSCPFQDGAYPDPEQCRNTTMKKG